MLVAQKEYQLTASSVETALQAGWSFLGFDSATPVIVETTDGLRIALFHFSEGCEIPVVAYQADLLACCHPEALPEELREKHAFPNWRGCVGGRPLEAARVLPFIITIDDNDYI